MLSLLRRRVAAGFVALTLAAQGTVAAQMPARLGASEAAARAQERFHGDILDVELKDARRDEPARTVYEVKLLTSWGSVIKVRLDAANGTFLQAEGDDLVRARRPAPSPKAAP